MASPLSEEQWAALATDRHLAVVANAGSGKTRVLTYRYLWLLVEHRVEIDRVVAITFTTKAAAEMRERVRTLIQEMLENPAERAAMGFSRTDDDVVRRLREIRRQLGDARISTFHSFCAGLLRQFGHVVDIDPEAVELSDRDTATMRDRALRRALHRYMAEHRVALLEVYEALDFTAFEDAVGSLARSAERFHILEALHGESVSVEAQTERAIRQALHLLGASIANLVDGVIASVEASEDPAHEQTREYRTACVRVRSALRDPDGISRATFAETHAVLNTLFTTEGKARKAAVFPGSREVDAIDKKLLTLCKVIGAGDGSDRDLAQGVVAWHAARVAQLASDLYHADKRERNAIDFDDMMSGVVDLLDRFPDIARYVSSTIAHVMVDEYQDTNPTQYRLMQLLVPQLRDPELPAGPRVFVVGDDKQGIYGFRDADVRLFRRTVDDLRRINEREGSADQPTLLTLATSYRMAPRLANATNALCSAFFAESSEYDVPYAPLVCGRSAEYDGSVGTLQALVTDTGEFSDQSVGLTRMDMETHSVVQYIVQILSEGTLQVVDKGLRPVGPGDIAVLARRTAGVSAVAAALHEAQVPFQVHGGRAFFSRPEVADLRNLLIAVVDPEDPLALAAVLRSPIFRMTDADLTTLAVGPETRGVSWKALDAGSRATSASSEMRAAVRVIAELRERLRHEPLTDLLRDALTITDWHATVFEHPRAAQILANVEKTFDIIRSAAESPGATVRDVLDAIAVPADVDRESESAYDLDPNAVQVMTIHAAKGLEFPVVIICDLAGSAGSSSYLLTDRLGLTIRMGSHTMFLDSDKPVELPKGLIAQANAVIEQEREMAEARRLLYVALTRGQDHVVVSFVQKFNKPDKNGVVNLHAPTGAMATLLQPLLLGDDPMLPVLAGVTTSATYTPARGPFQYHDRTEEVDWSPAPLTISVTQLLPSDDVGGSDSGSATAMAIGTIVHDTLEQALRTGTSVTADELRSTARQHPLAAAETVRAALVHLDLLRSSALWEGLQAVQTERTIGAMLGDTLVYGRVDAMRVSGAAAEVWDWKTNAVSNATLRDVAEHYRLQMEAYAWILLSTQPLNSVTTRLVFTSMLGDGMQGAVVEHTFTAADLQPLSERLRTAVSGGTPRR